MKKRSFRSTFVSVILVITVAISIVNLVVTSFTTAVIPLVQYIHHLGCVYGHYLPVLREVSRYLGIHFDNAHEQGIYSL